MDMTATISHAALRAIQNMEAIAQSLQESPNTFEAGNRLDQELRGLRAALPMPPDFARNHGAEQKTQSRKW